METPATSVPTPPSPSTFSKIGSKLYKTLPTYKGSIWELLVASLLYKITYLYKLMPTFKKAAPYYIFYLPTIDTVVNTIPFLLLGMLTLIAFFTTFALYQQVLFYTPPTP